MHPSVSPNKVHTKTPQSYHYSQVFKQMFFKQMLNFSKPIMSWKFVILDSIKCTVLVMFYF